MPFHERSNQHSRITELTLLTPPEVQAAEPEGIFNTETGKRFLNNILEMGGSEEPMELFKRFRGREPQIDAMLRHAGISA